MSPAVVSISDLQDLDNIWLDYAKTSFENATTKETLSCNQYSLYRSAARCHLGLATDHGDSDIGVVFRVTLYHITSLRFGYSSGSSILCT